MLAHVHTNTSDACTCAHKHMHYWRRGEDAKPWSTWHMMNRSWGKPWRCRRPARRIVCIVAQYAYIILYEFWYVCMPVFFFSMRVWSFCWCACMHVCMYACMHVCIKAARFQINPRINLHRSRSMHRVRIIMHTVHKTHDDVVSKPEPWFQVYTSYTLFCGLIYTYCMLLYIYIYIDTLSYVYIYI